MLLWLGSTISFAMNSESERKLRIPGNRTRLPLAHCSVRKWIKERLQVRHWALVATGITPSAALLLGLVGCTYSPTGYAQQTRDLIIVAGQSNAVGFSSNVENFTAHPADRNIPFWWRTGDPPADRHDASSGGRWSHLQSQHRGQPNRRSHNRQFGNFANRLGGFGPEISIGRTLHKSWTTPISILKVAYNATNLSRDWTPFGGTVIGESYRALLTEYQHAAERHKQKASNYTRGAGMDSGEADAKPYAARHMADG